VNRKQLEDCAWAKTPKDERRAQKERYDWKTQQTIVERLKGNAREVRVFDPSGSTEATMSPWVPLWSLYSDELEQRCKEEREPKLREPYNRMRADYTGDVESSPGTARTAAGRGGSSHHATKKKSPAQLQREIAEVLARAPKKVAGFARPATRQPGYQIVSVPILKGPRGIGPSGLDSPREHNESAVFSTRAEAEAYLPSVKRFAADFGREAVIKEVW